MHSYDANGQPDLNSFNATGKTTIFTGPNVSMEIAHEIDVTQILNDAKFRQVSFVGFLFRIESGTDSFEIPSSGVNVAGAPVLEIYQ